MSSFILQLFVISAFGLMVQSALIDDVSTLIFCAAESPYDEINDFKYANFTPSSLNITKTIPNIMFNHFSDQCKNFTKAMTFKHLLQEHFFSNDTALEVNPNDAKNLSTILTSLQSLANIFNDIEINEYSNRCVKLTPAQYRIMYYVQYNTTSLLESWKDDIAHWYLAYGSHCD